jgi:hypothetical protein
MKGVAYKVFWHCPCCCVDCQHVWCIQFAVQFVEVSASVHVSGNACVPSYVITIGRREVTVLFEKWAIYLQNIHSLKNVPGIVKFMFEGQTFLPHLKGACLCARTPESLLFPVWI